MAEVKTAMDVGYEMADLLLAWQHGMSHEDVADAIMYALQRYSWDARSPWVDRTQRVLVHAPGEDQVPLAGKDPLT